jgi:2-polyprenyl-6-methoxyphenol hydroxylase-like FAD-dependent oxidoreductase
MPLQIAIIGAGIAGLSAAIGLNRAGHNVVVIGLLTLTVLN